MKAREAVLKSLQYQVVQKTDSFGIYALSLKWEQKKVQFHTLSLTCL